MVPPAYALAVPYRARDALHSRGWTLTHSDIRRARIAPVDAMPPRGSCRRPDRRLHHPARIALRTSYRVREVLHHPSRHGKSDVLPGRVTGRI